MIKNYGKYKIYDTNFKFLFKLKINEIRLIFVIFKGKINLKQQWCYKELNILFIDVLGNKKQE